MIFYRHLNRISQSRTAQGTLAMPFHSTQSIDKVFDTMKYIEELKSLPAEFQPVKVFACM